MSRMKIFFFILMIIYCQSASYSQKVNWVEISTKKGDLEVPNPGKQQTSAAVGDIDKDGINDFCISERTSAPGMVWYRRDSGTWKRYIVEDSICYIEAGTVIFDIDNDGDQDIIAGGESKTNQLWWWENPYPDFSRTSGWNRYLIRNSGGNKIHDQIIGDFDGDSRPDLVFWAQGDQVLYFSRIPEKPEELTSWKLIEVFKYYNDGQMEQHGTYPPWKKANEHEGLAKADIDGDGVRISSVEVSGSGILAMTDSLIILWMPHIPLAALQPDKL